MSVVGGKIGAWMITENLRMGPRSGCLRMGMREQISRQRHRQRRRQRTLRSLEKAMLATMLSWVRFVPVSTVLLMIRG